MSCRRSPRKAETIAGGASFAPSRWSFPACATVWRRRSPCRETPVRTAARKTRNWALSCGLSPGAEEVVAPVVGEAPVDVFSGPVDAGERLLVEEELQVVAVGHPLHRLHDQHVVVGGDVGVLEQGGQLILRRRNLVVPGLDRDAELVKLKFGFEHAGQDALGDGAKVVVFHLLPLGGAGAEEGPPGVDQVGAGVVEGLVDEEVFLLGAAGRLDPGAVGPEQLQDADGVLADGVHRAEQGGLLVEGFAGPRAEGGRDAEGRPVRVLEDEGRAGRVPGGVAAGLERVADAARGERRGVRLAADEFLARELGDGRAGVGGREERVVLLGRQAGHRLEPVGVVGGPALHGPLLHRGGGAVGDVRVERDAPLDRGAEGLVDRLGEARAHDLVGEDVDPEQLPDRGFAVGEAGGVGAHLVVPGGDGGEGGLPGVGWAHDL